MTLCTTNSRMMGAAYSGFRQRGQSLFQLPFLPSLLCHLFPFLFPSFLSSPFPSLPFPSVSPFPFFSIFHFTSLSFLMVWSRASNGRWSGVLPPEKFLKFKSNLVHSGAFWRRICGSPIFFPVTSFVNIFCQQGGGTASCPLKYV